MKYPPVQTLNRSPMRGRSPWKNVLFPKTCLTSSAMVSDCSSEFLLVEPNSVSDPQQQNRAWAVPSVQQRFPTKNKPVNNAEHCNVVGIYSLSDTNDWWNYDSNSQLNGENKARQSQKAKVCPGMSLGFSEARFMCICVVSATITDSLTSFARAGMHLLKCSL